MEPEVIYADKDILAVNKPAGLVVHGRADSPADEPTLVKWLLVEYPEIKKVGDDPELRPGIVHRLDKETSGVMVVARTQGVFGYLKSLFQAHALRKTYLAVVQGVPREKEGVIDKPIGIRNGTLKRSTRSSRMKKEAVTAYKVLRTWKAPGADGKESAFSLLEVKPETGRTHQIRVHLASIGHPVVGDSLYGPGKRPAWAGRLMLHAAALEFTLPDGTRLRLEAECPFGFSPGYTHA